MRIVRYYPRAASGDGGMTNAVRCWSKGLVKAGAQVVIAFQDGNAAPEWRNSGVEWRAVRHAGPPHLEVPVGLGEVLRGADLLVLHSAWTLHNLWAGALARRLGVPYLLEPRGAYDPHILRRKRLLKKAWWLAGEQELVLKARAVHLFFESEREHLHALGYDGNVVIAPNGVEAPEGITWDGGSGGYVLWMGRFDPEHKGLDMLVKAVHLISHDQRPRLRLHGPDRRGGKDVVRRLVHSLKLEPWINLGEPVYGRAKYELLSRACGFVYPSRWEGFGNSVAEAVSIGVPTLTTPYPLGRYLSSQQGCIMAEATPEGLAAGLRALHFPQVPEIGRRGAQLVRKEITWDHVAESWLGQVQALL